MKKMLTILSGCLLVIESVAQTDIGIGTSLPQAKLHVVGNFRVGGVNNGSKFLAFDSANGQFKWNNSNLFIPTSQSIIQHSASAEGLFYNDPNLEYRYQDGTPQFTVNRFTGNGYFKRFLGIGNNPIVPVHLASITGPKTIFFGERSDYNYGFSVQSYQLLIHNDRGPSYLPSSILFGYGRSENFSETMRIQSDGLVGLGVSTPGAALDVNRLNGYSTADIYGTQHITHFNYGPNEYTYIRGGKNNAKVSIGDVAHTIIGVGIEPEDYSYLFFGSLQVAGRTLIRSGGTLGTSPGIWFNNKQNTITTGFIGMENDDYVGFYGAQGAGWAFGMNTVSGALKFGGSTGSPGMVLQSNGSSSPPSWVSPNRAAFDNTLSATSNVSVPITWNVFAEIPGLNVTFNTPGNSTILVKYNIVLNVQGSCTTAEITIRAFGEDNYTQNSTPTRHTISCNKEISVSGLAQMKAAAGTHTVSLHAVKTVNANNATASCSCALSNIMIVQVIPE